MSTTKSQSSHGRQVKDKTGNDKPFFSTSVAVAVGVLAIGALCPLGYGLLGETKAKAAVLDRERLPDTAQIIDQRSFNVLERVPPPNEANATTVGSLLTRYVGCLLTETQRFLWPGVTHESLLERPFHVYDVEFLEIIGNNPTLTLLATSDTDPIFHEAVVWFVNLLLRMTSLKQAKLILNKQEPAYRRSLFRAISRLSRRRNRPREIFHYPEDFTCRS
jgi:hypothetical protein